MSLWFASGNALGPGAEDEFTFYLLCSLTPDGKQALGGFAGVRVLFHGGAEGRASLRLVLP